MNKPTIRHKKQIHKIIYTIIGLIATYYLFFATPNIPNTIPSPTQNTITPETITHTDFDGEPIDMTLHATYEIDGIVQRLRKYESDATSSVSSRDFVLTRGDLHQPSIDKHIQYSHVGRRGYFRYDNETPVSGGYISTHFSNNHIIPANDTIAAQIKKVKKNDYISLEGYLATVHFPDGDRDSSITRDDSGDGACEILYVTDVIIH